MSLSQEAEELLERIAYPENLGPGFEQHQIIETHISVVIIGASEVLKFKKAVSYPFVDHTAFEQRLQSASQEVILNRRLSRRVYLGLRFVLEDGSVSKLLEPDEVSAFLESRSVREVMVVMRRLPREKMLDHNLESQVIAPLSKVLASFHHQALLHRPEQKPPLVSVPATDNIKALKAHSGWSDPQTLALELVSANTVCFLQQQLDLIKEREEFVVDGHGDLRAEHICVEDDENFSIIDCLEFSPELRRVDILNDLAFLVMDLEHLGRSDLSDELIQEYQQYHEVDASLLSFYVAYRALVRAKIALLQGRDPGNYLGLACRHALGLDKPWLLLIAGPMGSGKSTLARFLAEGLGVPWIRSDEVRGELFGVGETEDYGQGKYSPEATSQTYAAVLEKAKNYLECSQPVIVDACFSQRQQRMAFLECADLFHIPVHVVMCQAPTEELLRRITKRQVQGQDISEARPELLAEQLSSFESGQGHLLDTTSPLPGQAREVLDLLVPGDMKQIGFTSWIDSVSLAEKC